MIYEIAVLPVHKEHIDAFRRAFAEVAPLLSRAKGYLGHMLAQGVETPERRQQKKKWNLIKRTEPGISLTGLQRQNLLDADGYSS